jgi:hypothetical protein
MSRDKRLTQAQYGCLRSVIDDLMEPYRSDPDLHVEAFSALIDAVVAEGCDMFGLHDAAGFISDSVNDSLKFEHEEGGEP